MTRTPDTVRGSSAARKMGPLVRDVIRPGLAVAAGLLAGAGLVWLLGISPLAALQVLFETVFASRSGFTDTVLQAIPLLLIALGYTVAFQARIWTVGGEGQLHASAIAVAAVVFTLPAWPPPLVGITAALVAGTAAGMVLALVPAWLRVYRQVNEVVSTLMLNFVAVLAMKWLIRTVYQDPYAGTFQSRAFPPAFALPLIEGTRLHVGLLVALALVPLLFYTLAHAGFGFRVRAVGANPWASQASGIPVSRTIIGVFLASGGLAGLAGAVYVLGVTHRLLADLSPGFGYTAIMVALLSRNHPLICVPAAFFFSGLTVGSEAIQAEYGIPSDFMLVVMGILVLFVLAGDVLRKGGRTP